MMNRILPFIFLTLFLGIGAAEASGDTDSRSLARCVSRHDSCVSACVEKNADAGCIVACATKEAQCAAAVSLGKTGPWVKKKADDLKKFLDDFLRDLPKPKPSPPEPNPDLHRT
jgi:hypothetical protein